MNLMIGSKKRISILRTTFMFFGQKINVTMGVDQ